MGTAGAVVGTAGFVVGTAGFVVGTAVWDFVLLHQMTRTLEAPPLHL